MPESLCCSNYLRKFPLSYFTHLPDRQVPNVELIIAGNGSIPIHFSISPVNDPAGLALGVALVVHEDTERRKAEQAQIASNQRLDAIMDNTTAVIYAKDSDGYFLMVNSHFEEVIGTGRDEIIGKTDFDLFPADIASLLRANDQHVLQERRPITYEEHVLQKNGPRDYISAKVPIYDALGKSQAICGISTDITDQRRRQRGYKVLNSWTQILTDRPRVRISMNKCSILTSAMAPGN